MCARYTTNVTAAPNTTSESGWIELLPASGLSIAIIKIDYSAQTVTSLTPRIRVYRETTAGTGTTASGTIANMRAEAPASTTTATVKSGTNTFTTGTLTDTLLDISFYSRAATQWIARDRAEYLWSNKAERIMITATYANGTTTANSSMSVFWEE